MTDAPRARRSRSSPLRAGALSARFATSSAGARGSLLAAALVTMTIAAIMLSVAATQWSFILQRDREKELIFRGVSIARAIDEWQQATKAPPTSLEQMTKPPRPTLRKAYVDPMTARFEKDGELVEGTGAWEYLGPEAAPGGGSGPRGPSAASSPRGGATAGARGGLGRGAPQVSAILGVASTSEEESVGRYADNEPASKYSDWKFRVLGANAAMGRSLEGGYELPRPPGFGGLRMPGGPPLNDFSATAPGGRQSGTAGGSGRTGR